MFIVSLTYKVSLEQVDQHIQEHVAFLDQYYASGHFIASGRKVPRDGGVILVLAESKEKVQQIITEDPFFRYELADYAITEFEVSKRATAFEQLI